LDLALLLTVVLTVFLFFLSLKKYLFRKRRSQGVYLITNIHTYIYIYIYIYNIRDMSHFFDTWLRHESWQRLGKARRKHSRHTTPDEIFAPTATADRLLTVFLFFSLSWKTSFEKGVRKAFRKHSRQLMRFLRRLYIYSSIRDMTHLSETWHIYQRHDSYIKHSRQLMRFLRRLCIYIYIIYEYLIMFVITYTLRRSTRPYLGCLWFMSHVSDVWVMSLIDESCHL
jgi:hypothetical protein